MNMKWLFAASIMSAVVLTACAKKEQAPAAEENASAPSAAVSSGQEAAIAALDQPVMVDETHNASEASAAQTGN